MKRSNENNNPLAAPVDPASSSALGERVLSGSVALILYSDVQCPWCFIAKKRVDPILKSANGAYIKLQWRPLELHPYIPIEGMDSRAFFRQYMGADNIIQERQAMVTEIGHSLGIQIDFARMRKQPNTRLAHRLIAYAQDRAVASEVTEALFQGFFCEGVDIGHVDQVLALLASKSVPLEQAEVRDFLNGGGGEARLQKDLEQARALGIRGAPTYMRKDGRCSGSFQSEADVHAFLKTSSRADRMLGENHSTGKSK